MPNTQPCADRIPFSPYTHATRAAEARAIAHTDHVACGGAGDLLGFSVGESEGLRLLGPARTVHHVRCNPNMMPVSKRRIRRLQAATIGCAASNAIESLTKPYRYAILVKTKNRFG